MASTTSSASTVQDYCGASGHAKLNRSNQIRVVTIDSQPWFVATDVCRVLSISQPTFAYRRLADDEVKSVVRTTLGLPNGAAMYLVSESGLYKLIMRSDKPEARKFQDWVTREVLPAIDKDGMYVMGEEKVRTGEMRYL